ncbi:MAG: glycosyltransferase, partial [Lachnospiraceae bacterium]|nr:glycosyltransferase [Lachnospiraceae bacterium]
MKKRYVLIPAYKPEETLLSFIQALEERNLRVIVVNDGSGEEYLPLFQKMEDNTGVNLIQLEQNRGKGAALKAGLSYLQTLDENFQIITVDADGQHSLQDT